MSRDSNLYTFLFVGIMIVGIASILAYTSQTLKPMQDENVKNEKMQNILSTVGINVSREEAEKSYKKYIVEELALKIDGSSKVPTLRIIELGLLGFLVPIAVPHSSQKRRVIAISMSFLLYVFGLPFTKLNLSKGTITKTFG